jgi:hypothetical protein
MTIKTKTPVTVGAEHAMYKGLPCDVRKLSRGWTDIIDNTGRARKVRATEVSIVPPQAEAGKMTAESIEEINKQTESNTMASASPSARKRSTKVRVPRTAKAALPRGVRKVTSGEGTQFKRFDSYVQHKTAAGNVAYDNGDDVSTKMRGMTLAEVYEFVAKKMDVSERTLKEQYKHLNAGMQRMNLGNRVRGLERAKAKAKEERAAARAS